MNHPNPMTMGEPVLRRGAGLYGLVLLACMLAGESLQAQRAVGRVEPSRVEVGQPARLLYEVNSTDGVELATLPSAPGAAIKLLDQATTRSMRQINNGRITSSITQKFLFSVHAESEGRIQIQSPTFTADAKEFQANSVALVVEPANPLGLARVSLKTPRLTYTRGETISLSFEVLLAKLPESIGGGDPLSQYDQGMLRAVRPPFVDAPFVREPPFGRSSFNELEWAKAMEAGRGRKGLRLRLNLQGAANARFAGPRRTLTREHDGQRRTYVAYRFDVDLVADTTGIFPLLPVSLEGKVVDAQPGQQAVWKDVWATSDALTITIKDPPLEGRPESFGGAVGTFQFEASAPTPDRVQLGDPVWMTLVIKGRGLLDGIEVDLAKQLGPQFRVDPPKVQASVASGEPTPEDHPKHDGDWRQYDFKIRPLDASVEEIPVLRFAYYDVAAKQYVELTAGPFPLEVTEGAVGGRAVVVGARGSRESATLLAATLSPDVEDLNRFENQRVSLGLWFGLALGLLPLYWGLNALARKHREQAADPSVRRRGEAGKRANRRLSEALGHADTDSRAALEAARDALRGWWADHQALEEAAVTHDELKQAVAAQGFDATIVSAVDQLLDDVEAAQFGGGEMKASDVRALVESVRPVVKVKSPIASKGLRTGLVLLVAVFSNPVAAQSADVLQGAHAADEAGRHAEAAAAFESQANENFDNAWLHYNAGNAWQRAGELGRAIAAYRRAQFLLRGDANLERNLAQALERRTMVVAPPAESPVLKALFFWRSGLGFPAQVRLGFALACCAFLAAVLRLLAARGRSFLRSVALAGVLGAALVFLGAWLDQREYAGGRCGAVVQSETTLRTHPDRGAEAVITESLQDGVEVRVLRALDGWYEVEVGGEHTGYLRAEQLTVW